MSATPPHHDLPPPGWYVDGAGQQRWWDGVSWGPLASDTSAAAVAGAQADPSRPSTLDPGAALSYAWAKFSAYAWQFVALTLVMFTISIVGMIVAIAALIPAAFTSSGSNTGVTLTAWAIYVAAMLLTLVFNLLVVAGAMRAALAVTRGEAPTMSMLVSTEHLGSYVGTILLVSVATTLGMFLCIIPGIAVACLAAYAPFIALEDGENPIDAISQSVALVRANLGPVLIVLILAYAVYYAGSLACYVGLLVSVPVALIMMAYSYRVLRQQPLAP